METTMEVKITQPMRVALSRENDKRLREEAAAQGRAPTNLANWILAKALEKPQRQL
jgi:hypothetical protein